MTWFITDIQHIVLIYQDARRPAAVGRAGATGVVDNAGLAARVRGRLLPGVRQPVSVARADRGVGAAERDARHLDAVKLRPAAAERRHHRRRVRAAAVGLRAPR